MSEAPTFEVWPTVASLPREGGRTAQAASPSTDDAPAPITPGGHDAGRTTAPPIVTDTGPDGAARTGTGEAGDAGGTGERRVDADDAGGREKDADPGRVAGAADPGRDPGGLGELDANRIAETEAAPGPTADDSQLLGRSEDHDGHPERMVSSQLLWDGSLSVSRMDESIVPPAGVEEASAPRATVTVALLVDGRPDDVRECVRALVARTEVKVLALDLGDVDGAGAVLHELAGEFPRRVDAWHVAELPHWRGGSAGWGESRNALLRLDDSDVHVVMDTSVILDGDAVTPLVKALEDENVTAAGWEGVTFGDDGRGWADAEAGEVRGLHGHLLAVRRDAALAAGGFPAEARYHGDAGLEFSLGLPGTLVALGKDLPVHRERDHADDGVDPAYRERETAGTRERVLALLRSP
ncbi:glycosyltransferase [Streptosporangium sp. NPDC050855]|uniref:glycosyltransferase n=1 Tax=Streptosporangium sp. NPDC050855 TaxID=3366194 RepID=UPI00379AA8E7